LVWQCHTQAWSLKVGRMVGEQKTQKFLTVASDISISPSRLPILVQDSYWNFRLQEADRSKILWFPFRIMQHVAVLKVVFTAAHRGPAVESKSKSTTSCESTNIAQDIHFERTEDKSSLYITSRNLKGYCP
jgi:hypothetical protein